ncbi:hypothetical protein QCA50_020260 [Cerrena zonata]|uniref:XPG-I domain-containing protein n=1 Tax=Cerrena zonata TaxID=2478898 RepID=A0AAW0FAQ1_9APHY
MSKTQNQLTNEEGLFWDHLTDTGGEGPTSESMHAIVTTLAQKSAAMSESYKRRTQLPNTQTYRESKAIIQAMGVPCIETDGPYEAEALASSIVLNGLADYVGSEDTDVLVYEAPMLRNVANRGTPLGYVDFALLLGTDFSRRIKNVGPARALKFIRDHGSIERVLETEAQYPPRIPIPTYLEQIVLARSVFDTLPPIPNPSTLMQGEYDEEKVMSVLREYGLHWAAEEDWDYQNALAGNFFADNPRSD